MTANRYGAEFDAVLTRSRNLGLAALGFRFLWQVETGRYTVVTVAQVRGTEFGATQIHLTSSRSNPCAGQLRGAADLQIHTLGAADAGSLADTVLMRVTAIEFQRRRVIHPAKLGVVGHFVLVSRRCFFAGHTQIHIDLGAGLAVLTTLHVQVTADLAADRRRINPRAGHMHIPGAVQYHAVSLDLTVLLGRALQIINPDPGPGIEAVITCGDVLFIDDSRCAVAQVAAGIQRDTPVGTVLSGLGRLLIDPALMRIKADARGTDLGALQVNRITAEAMLP